MKKLFVILQKKSYKDTLFKVCTDPQNSKVSPIFLNRM